MNYRDAYDHYKNAIQRVYSAARETAICVKANEYMQLGTCCNRYIDAVKALMNVNTTFMSRDKIVDIRPDFERSTNTIKWESGMELTFPVI